MSENILHGDIAPAPTPPNTPFTPESSKPHPVFSDGEQHIYAFPNTRKASVIRSQWSYGGDEGLWELAVLDKDHSLDYSTPITDDVIGRLDDAGVAEILQRIHELPAPEQAGE